MHPNSIEGITHVSPFGFFHSLFFDDPLENDSQRDPLMGNDAKLILSTSATDVPDTGVPASDDLVIQPKEKPRPPPPPPPLNSQRRSATAAFGSAPLRARKIGGGPPLVQQSAPLPPLVQTAAVVSKSPMAVSYAVDEHTTIPSDHQSHKVLVAIIPFEATISHIASPAEVSDSVHPGMCPPIT